MSLIFAPTVLAHSPALFWRLDEPAEAESQNLYSDPSFEGASHPMDGVTDEVTSTDFAFTGLKSLKTSQRLPADSAAYWVPVTAGRQYRVSCMVRHEGGAARTQQCFINWKNAANGTISTSSGTSVSVAPATWTELVRTDAIAPAGAVKAQITWDLSAAALPAYIDELMVIDTGSGIATDVTGNGRHGERPNAAAAPGAPGSFAGSGAYSFDGATVTQVALQAGYSPWTAGGTEKITVLSIVNRVGGTTDDPIWSGMGAITGSVPRLHWTSAAVPNFQVRSGLSVSWPARPIVGAWSMQALTYDPVTGIAELFVNGSSLGQKQMAAGDWTWAFAGFQLARAGTSSATANLWQGEIDELAIFPRILTSVEITEIYNAWRAEEQLVSIPPVLGDRYEERLAEAPGWLRETPEWQAFVRCATSEGQRMEELAKQIRDTFIPYRVPTLGLPVWEAILGLPGLGDESVRRDQVLSGYSGAIPDSRGVRWEEEVTRRIGVGWSYEEDSAGFEITITVPFTAGSDAFLSVEPAVRPITPAHLEITVLSAAGFILDQSQLDQEQFHPS